jgi:uncharacterized protein YcbK (DUF882 family)
MGNLTANISRAELKCKCGKCSRDAMDFELVNIVQDVCDHFSEQLGRKVTLAINSANRCETYNASVGGKPDSRHLYSDAMDISIKGVAPSDVYKYINTKYPDRLGLGSYSTFTHVDTRSYKARW